MDAPVAPARKASSRFPRSGPSVAVRFMRPSPLNTRPAAKGVAGETKGNRTTMATTSKNRPTHAAYMVEGEGMDASAAFLGVVQGLSKKQ
jgi:hypothetical protein